MHPVGGRVKEIALMRERTLSLSSGMVEDKHAVGAPPTPASGLQTRWPHRRKPVFRFRASVRWLVLQRANDLPQIILPLAMAGAG